MQADFTVSGKVIGKYHLQIDEINQLNEIFDAKKSTLQDFSHKLAGNVKEETNIMNMLSSVPIIYSMYSCMQDYVQNTAHLLKSKNTPIKDYHIDGAWINDMVEGDFNPPHVHRIDPVTKKASGYSTVLFLKTPEIVAPTNLNKESMNGCLTFTTVDGENCISFQPAVGDFYIFQASHQHFVMPFKLKHKDRIRRSLSFNFTTIFEDYQPSKSDSSMAP
tara:strand:- start:183 stop:839 length:657 start_codon:yes stop_codon:yes gene_type:complete